MAYIKCIISPKMGYEYMWNCSANLQGGMGKNIPNDNLLEIMVQTVKKKIYSQEPMQLAPVFRELHSRLKFKKKLSRICKPNATRNTQDQKDPMQIKPLTFWK